jgi:hypothetical protein
MQSNGIVSKNNIILKFCRRQSIIVEMISFAFFLSFFFWSVKLQPLASLRPHAAHQRSIFKIQKTFRGTTQKPKTIHFCQNI